MRYGSLSGICRSEVITLSSHGSLGPSGPFFLGACWYPNGWRPGDQGKQVICDRRSLWILSLSGIAKNPFSRIMGPQEKGVLL